MFRDPNSMFNIVLSFLVGAILVGLGIYRHYDMISIFFGSCVTLAGLKLLSNRMKNK